MLSERFADALVFTHQLHREHVRKGSGTPYVHHLLGVASLVGENGGTEDQVIGALLHDAIEDCIDRVPDVRAQIAGRYGEGVLAIVEGCTDADMIPKPPWRARKEAYIERLRAKPADHPALIVSVADKVHNARSILSDYRQIGDELWGRFKGGRDGTLWYYAELCDAFREKGDSPLVDELELVVSAIREAVAR